MPDTWKRLREAPWQMGDIDPDLLARLQAEQKGPIPELSAPTPYRAKPDLDMIDAYFDVQRMRGAGRPEAKNAPWNINRIGFFSNDEEAPMVPQPETAETPDDRQYFSGQEAGSNDTSSGLWDVLKGALWALERPQQMILQGAKRGSEAFGDASRAGINPALSALASVPSYYMGALRGVTGTGEDVRGRELTEGLTNGGEWGNAHEQALGNFIDVAASPLDAIAPVGAAASRPVHAAMALQKMLPRHRNIMNRLGAPLENIREMVKERRLPSSLDEVLGKYGVDYTHVPQSIKEIAPLTAQTEGKTLPPWVIEKALRLPGNQPIAGSMIGGDALLSARQAPGNLQHETGHRLWGGLLRGNAPHAKTAIADKVVGAMPDELMTAIRTKYPEKGNVDLARGLMSQQQKNILQHMPDEFVQRFEKVPSYQKKLERHPNFIGEELGVRMAAGQDQYFQNVPQAQQYMDKSQVMQGFQSLMKDPDVIPPSNAVRQQPLPTAALSQYRRGMDLMYEDSQEEEQGQLSLMSRLALALYKMGI